jgi:hypothetical protein
MGRHNEKEQIFECLLFLIQLCAVQIGNLIAATGA